MQVMAGHMPLLRRLELGSMVLGAPPGIALLGSLPRLQLLRAPLAGWVAAAAEEAGAASGAARTATVQALVGLFAGARYRGACAVTLSWGGAVEDAARAREDVDAARAALALQGFVAALSFEDA
jgi:hypothetical protein